jgi:quinohemoprotein ethanol dehydrogenase
LTTAGNLVFQGTATGQLMAYHAETGEVLWTYEAGLGISAPPITYRINNRQYVSVLVGMGGGITGLGSAVTRPLGWAYGIQTRRLITFSLEGEAVVPVQPPPYLPEPMDAPDFIVNEELAEIGATEYLSCRSCHGPNAIAGGMAPDLRASPIPLNETAFRMVVRDGLMIEMGMPAFPDITYEQLQMIRHFIRMKADETK